MEAFGMCCILKIWSSFGSHETMAEELCKRIWQKASSERDKKKSVLEQQAMLGVMEMNE